MDFQFSCLLFNDWLKKVCLFFLATKQSKGFIDFFRFFYEIAGLIY